MNATPSAYVQFGQTLAFTERSLTSVLRAHLAEREIEPETWYALKLISQGDPEVARHSLTNDLAGSRDLDTRSVASLLSQLEAAGLITGEASVQLTPNGRAAFENLRDYVVGATVKLLSSFDLDDIETTVRTLQAITRQVEMTGYHA